MLEKLIEARQDVHAFEYYLQKYENAIELYYKKNSGTLRLSFSENDVSVKTLIKKLSKPDVIQL